jgi:flagellar hook assembly protein FlgD
MGRQVALLADRTMSAGRHVIVWDGTDQFGKKVASGVYLYRLEAGQTVLSKRMLLLK